MPQYRIYYGDETTFEGEPWDAPTRNVQAIAFDDPDKAYGHYGRIVMQGWDLYIYTDAVRGWVGTNKYADLLMHLEDGIGPGGVRAILRGKWIDRVTWKRIVDRAKNDPGLSEKRRPLPAVEEGEQ